MEWYRLRFTLWLIPEIIEFLMALRSIHMMIQVYSIGLIPLKIIFSNQRLIVITRAKLALAVIWAFVSLAGQIVLKYFFSQRTVVCRLARLLAIKEEGSLLMVIKTKYALSAIPLANNVLMKEVLETDQDARNALITASTSTLPPRNAQVLVKTVFMSHPDSLALHVPSPAINALAQQQPAQIALKIANFLSCIL